MNKKRNTIICLIAAVVLIFSGVKVVGYVRTSKLCQQIKAGNNIETNISDGTTAPLFLDDIATIFQVKGVKIPLVEACYYGNVQAVEVLLENNANPNFFIDGRWSPLEATIVGDPMNESRYEIIKMLIDHGCDVNLHASSEPVVERISSYICAGNDDEIVKNLLLYLLENGANKAANGYEKAFHNIVRSGNVELAQILIEKYNFSVNGKGHEGKTPLIISVTYSERSATVEMVKMLIAHGADISIVDENGKSALDYATNLGYDDIAAVLTDNLIISPNCQ